MNFIKVENYDKLSAIAANIIASQVTLKPDCVLGLATGSSPLGTYAKLAEKYNAGELDFSKVTSVNLDEYVGLDGTNDQSYRYFMDNNLFCNINIDKAKTYVPNGCAEDLKAEGANYDAFIKSLGGIDLQLLGIGQNGHIGFNEPGASLYYETHLTDLTENTIQANSRFFASIDEVPKQAITMGLGTIMKAKKILLLASGKNKHEAIAHLLGDRIDPKVPATLLKVHPDVVIICDKAAYEG